MVMAQQPNVEIKRRRGMRKVRGRMTTVDLPVADVSIDGTLVAIFDVTQPTAPVCVVAEMLPEEEDAVAAAVAKMRNVEPDQVEFGEPAPAFDESEESGQA